MNAGQRIADYEFLGRANPVQSHFLYLYRQNSGLLRSRVQERIRLVAERSGWMEGKPFQADLFGQVTSPSLLGEMFFVVDTKRLDVEDVVAVLEGIAASAMDHHVLLMVEEGSKVLERPAWRAAVEKIGLIEERAVTIDNYRAVTRYLLQSSDLKEVDQFGNDDKFLRQMKKCVQGNRRISLFTASMEIDRIILTQVENGVVLDSDQDSAAEVREQRDLRLRLNQFLDERTTATLHPLLALADAALLAGNEPHHLVSRLFNASASIIAGRDQRYKRNREGNPAVLPYLVWGMLLLARGPQLLSTNLVVSFEQLCQDHHVAAMDPIRWLAYERNWQQVAICLLPVESAEPATLDRAREGLRSAIAARIEELGDDVDLRWLLPFTPGPAAIGAARENA